jgi:hypothetical protein
MLENKLSFGGSIWNYLGKEAPRVEIKEGSPRIYSIFFQTFHVYAVSATSVLSDNSDDQVLWYYAKKLGDHTSLNTITEEDLQEAKFWLRFSQERGFFYDDSALRSVQCGDFSHEIFQLPCFSTAELVFVQEVAYDVEAGVAGTLDFLVKHKDGSWSLHDIKTHGRLYSKEKELADRGIWALDRSVQPNKITKWRQQQVIYAQCLKASLGIEMRYSSTFLKNMHTNALSEEFLMTGDLLAQKWERDVKQKVRRKVESLFLDLDI